MDRLSPFDVADYLDGDETAAEYLVACLEDGDPAVVADAVRTIMRARGEEMADEPTLADFMALTKALGLAVRAKSCSWGIGLYPDREEFERRSADPRFSIPTLEHAGYIAVLDVDVDASLIRGRIVNAHSFPDFFGNTVEDVRAAFQEVVRREKARSANSGYEPERPQSKNLRPMLPTQFDQWFPKLSTTRGALTISLRHMDFIISKMEELGFFDEKSALESQAMTIADFQHGFALIAFFIESYAPMPSKIGWVIWRLSEELNLLAAGIHPQFLRPTAYSGTKTGSPKHRALRLKCACTVASLMRRGVSRDEACKSISRLLDEMKITTKKNGSAISARTILEFYNKLRRDAEITHGNFESGFYGASDVGAFLAEQKMDLEWCNPKGSEGAEFPEFNMKSPLVNLRDHLEILSPIV